MKNVYLATLLFLLAAVSQAAPPPPPFGVYPFEDDFESYNPNAGSLNGNKWTAGSTTFKAYGGHGVDSVPGIPSIGMAAQFNVNNPIDSITTKFVDSMTVNTQLTFAYRFVEATQYPNFATVLPSDAYLRIYGSDGLSPYTLLGEINSANFSPSTNFNYFVLNIPQFAGLAGQYFKIVFYIGGGNDHWVDIDNFRVGEPMPVSIKNNQKKTDWSCVSRGKTLQITDANASNFSLVNIAGSTIKSWQNIKGNNSISLNELPNGIYFLRRLSENGIETKKLYISE